MSSPNLILCRYVPIAPSRLFKLYVLSHISLRCVAPSKFWKCTLLPVVWYKTLISGEKVALRKSPTAFLGFVVMRAINQELSNLPFASWEIFDKKCKTLQFNGNKIKKRMKDALTQRRGEPTYPTKYKHSNIYIFIFSYSNTIHKI